MPNSVLDARESWLRAVVNRLTWSQSRVDAAELQGAASDSGAGKISDCACGVPITVVGRLRAVTVRPDQAVSAVEAQLYDGTGEITVVFLGRRRLPGITAGRSLAVHGRPVVRDGVPSMINPRYELLPTGSE